MKNQIIIHQDQDHQTEIKVDKLYREFEKLSVQGEPLTVAGIMMAQAMKIYKAMLSPDEFKLMTEHILESRDNINIEVDKPTLQ